MFIKKISGVKIFAVSALMMSANVIAAATADEGTIGARLDAGAKSLSSFGDFIMLAVGVTGVLICFMGAWGLKQYADDSRSNPLTKPLMYFLAGAIMTGFAAWQNVLGKTVTGSESDATKTGEFKATTI